MTWRALHVYYHAGQEDLLVDCLGPVVESCRSQGLAGWFFLRYWEGGPHLRFRLRAPDEAMDDILESARHRLEQYLEENPSRSNRPPGRLAASQRELARLEGREELEDELVSDNTVLDQPYEPELGKYGGEMGVAVAERIFEASSDITIRWLSSTPETKAGPRLGPAFGMLLAGLVGTGMNEGEMAGFLAHYCRFWSRYVDEASAARWPAKLEVQEQTLARHAAAVLSRRWEDGSPTGEALNRWAAAIQSGMSSLEKDADEILPAVKMLGGDASPRRRQRFVLSNYLHTHNNRLGVLPAHEAYLAYLGHHILSRLAGTDPHPIQHLHQTTNLGFGSPKSPPQTH